MSHINIVGYVSNRAILTFCATILWFILNSTSLMIIPFYSVLTPVRPVLILILYFIVYLVFIIVIGTIGSKYNLTQLNKSKWPKKMKQKQKHIKKQEKIVENVCWYLSGIPSLLKSHSRFNILKYLVTWAQFSMTTSPLSLPLSCLASCAKTGWNVYGLEILNKILNCNFMGAGHLNFTVLH